MAEEKKNKSKRAARGRHFPTGKINSSPGLTVRILKFGIPHMPEEKEKEKKKSTRKARGLYFPTDKINIPHLF